MSGVITSNEVMTIVRVGGMDLAAGTTIATLMDYVFGDVPDSGASLGLEAIKLFFQGFFTLFLGIEYRRSAFPQDFEDPTSAIVLIVTLFKQQNFWKRVTLLKYAALEQLFSYVAAVNYTPPTDITDPDRMILTQQKRAVNQTQYGLAPDPKMN